MKNNKRKSVIVLGIIILIALIPIIAKGIKATKTYSYAISATPSAGSTYTTDTEFEEFVKTDGTTYNIEEQDIKESTELDLVEELYGSYQLNYTGASAVVKSCLKSSKISIENQWYSKLSSLEDYEWLDQFEKDSLYESDDNFKDGSGNARIKGNSSAGELVKNNDGDTIYKAYLVVSCMKEFGEYQLENYPITLVGPNGKYIETKIEHIRKPPNNEDRYAGYMDITEFVQNQGYGYYYCCNIPYIYNNPTTSGSDEFASWKIIVVEENEDLPLRVLYLQLGAAYTSTSQTVEVAVRGIKSKFDGEVTGQLFYSMDGGDTGCNCNKLKWIIDGEEIESFYKYNDSSNVMRTNILPLPNILTRNNKAINTLTKFDDIYETNKSYLTYTYSDKSYTLAEYEMGADVELIDINTSNENIDFEIGNNKSEVEFEFSVSGVVLLCSGLGLTYDIEETSYETKINTEIESIENDKYSVKVSGYSENTYGENETGLHETYSKIMLDDDLEINNNVLIKAYFQKSEESEKIEIEEENIEIEDHTITIKWGDNLDEVCDLTLLGYKMTYEITGLSIGQIKEEYVNEIYVSGNLYTSGQPTETLKDRIAFDTSYIKFGNITITKNWVDDENNNKTRPENITINLYREGETEPVNTYSMDTDDIKNSQSIETGLVLLEDSSRIYEYSVVELEVPAEYTSSIDGLTITNTLNQYSYTIKYYYDGVEDTKKQETHKVYYGTTIDSYTDQSLGEYELIEEKNLPVTIKNSGEVIEIYYQKIVTDVSITKVWDDNENQDGKRPYKVTVKLLADGESTEQTLELNESNNWTGNFENLDKYKNGKEIEYTIQEETVDGYSSNTTGDMSEGLTITNSHTLETISISGTKTWDDSDNQDGKRPSKITVNLYSNGKLVESKTVTESDGWAYSFENLPKYKDGVEIVYTIDETAVEGYTTTYNGYDITNSYTPETTGVSVTKIWDDNNNQDGKRDNYSVTITGTVEDEEVYTNTQELDKDTLEYTWENLAKYYNGTEITYTVDETNMLEGYTKEVTGNQETGFIITNSYIPVEKEPESTPPENITEEPSNSNNNKTNNTLNNNVISNTVDNTTAKSSLPQTGQKILPIILFVGTVILAIVLYIKFRAYDDIK